jgi:hypothetical protein
MKGFHVILPVCWEVIPSTNFHRIARSFTEGLADRAGVQIDTKIYLRVSCIRTPNALHAETRLYNRLLKPEEFERLTANDIRTLAREPRRFLPPPAPSGSPVAQQDWQDAAARPTSPPTAPALRPSGAITGRGRLNRLTLDFIRRGALEGERAMRLFSAAANLAEFGCPADLAQALLTESALDSGLSPGEVRRQIECGLLHGHNALGDT